MKVAKWGNSLAVRLPADLVKSLGLKEGDELELRAGQGRLDAHKRLSDEELFEEVRRLRRAFPVNYKFDRDEANER